MRGKIFRTTLMVTLITLTVCIGIIVGMFFNFFENSYMISLSNEADYLVSSVEKYGKEYLDNVDFGNIRVSYIDADGTVIYDNKAVTEGMANHKDREEFLEAVKSGKGESVRLSETLSERTYYISRRLSTGDVIRISDTRESEWALVSRLFYQMLFVILLSVILSAIFSGRLARGVIKPINEIDLSNPVKGEVYEELTPLLARIVEQRKQIDEQMKILRKERREFSSITSNMSEGFIVIDKTTNILSSNKAAGELLNGGETPKEGSVFELERSEKFIKIVESALGGKHETAVLEKGNMFISVFANPVYEKDKVIGALLIFMDVTEREGREMLRREFTANVSHELKTPLTSILLAAEMIKNGMVKSEDTVHFSEKIYTEAKRLINLVNDTIKLSKLDEGNITADFRQIDAKAVITQSVDSVRSMAEAKNITIKEDVDDIHIKSIESLFDEIVYNLCDNAVKYTPEGGEVTVSFKEEGGKTVLKVSDNGIGIAQADQERIFERFYRADKSHQHSGGTGLGLSIVKHAVNLLSGSIKVESTLGKGSTFSVIL